MAYSSIPGTRSFAKPDPDKGYRACVRCGHVREARKRSVLCADCRDSLTPAERRLWAA